MSDTLDGGCRRESIAFRHSAFLLGDPQQDFIASWEWAGFASSFAEAQHPLASVLVVFGSAFGESQHALASVLVVFGSAFVGPQQAFASLQQAALFSQQFGLVSALQQALPTLQQASFAEQQSLDFGSSMTTAVKKTLAATKEPVSRFVNMKTFSSNGR